MKNRAPFAALTFAFTVCGAALGHSISDIAVLIMTAAGIAMIGGFAAAVSGVDD